MHNRVADARKPQKQDGKNKPGCFGTGREQYCNLRGKDGNNNHHEGHYRCECLALRKCGNKQPDDITIYYFVQSGGESPYFDNLFTKYDDYNSRVKVEYKDPVLHPKFASQYVKDSVTTNSFLVVNESTGKAKYVPTSEVLVQEFNYNTFSSQTTGVSLESGLNAAIQHVTNEEQNSVPTRRKVFLYHLNFFRCIIRLWLIDK